MSDKCIKQIMVDNEPYEIKAKYTLEGKNITNELNKKVNSSTLDTSETLVYIQQNKTGGGREDNTIILRQGAGPNSVAKRDGAGSLYGETPDNASDTVLVNMGKLNSKFTDDYDVQLLEKKGITAKGVKKSFNEEYITSGQREEEQDYTGEKATAEGFNNISRGIQSHAEGINNIVLGIDSHVEGGDLDGNPDDAQEFLDDTTIYDTEATAKTTGRPWKCKVRVIDSNRNQLYLCFESLVDNNTQVPPAGQGQNIETINFKNENWGLLNCIAIKNHTHVEGHGSVAQGPGAHAEGNRCIAKGNSSHAEGSDTLASGNLSHTEGWDNKATNTASHAEGGKNNSDGIYSHTEGYFNFASGDCSHAEGEVNKSLGNYSHVEGQNNIALGDCSHAEGGANTVSATYSHVEGNDNTVSGYNSHTEGWQNTVQGSYTHAEGIGHTVEGECSHAEGSTNLTKGHSSHAEGSSNHATGNYSHTEGRFNTATEAYSHAEGLNTESAGQASHAEGNYTKAVGNYSHTEGVESLANGNGSHAEGNSVAKGNYAHSEGWGTESNITAQHVQGRFNVVRTDKDYADIVGWGTSDTPKNISALDTNGNLYLKGNVYVECNNNSDNGVMLQKLPTVTAADAGKVLSVDANGQWVLIQPR